MPACHPGLSVQLAQDRAAGVANIQEEEDERIIAAAIDSAASAGAGGQQDGDKEGVWSAEELKVPPGVGCGVWLRLWVWACGCVAAVLAAVEVPAAAQGLTL